MQNIMRLTEVRRAIGLLIAGYASVAMYLGLVLKFNFLQSDVLTYWQNSLDWSRSIDIFHVPGYPLMIAFVRTISLGILPPLALMMPIIFVALIACLLLIYTLIKDVTAASSYAIIGMLLYGLWPFIGLTYAVYPLSDLAAMALFLGGLYALRKSNLPIAAILLGLAIVTHKSMWLFVGSSLVVWIALYRKSLSWRVILSGLILFIPLGCIWLIGYIQHGSAIWLVSDSLGIGIMSQGDLPIFDGMLGSLLHKGVIGIFKTAIMVSLALLCLIAMYISYTIKTPEAWYGFAIALSIFLLCALLKQNEIWAAMRFGRLLILPLMWIAGQRQVFFSVPARLRSAGMVILLLLLFASQFVYAYYMSDVYFS